jgi:cytochrome c-type biogenesis protein CcmE
MSSAGPVSPPVRVQGRRRRWGVLLGIGVIAVTLGYLAFSGISSALVYYLTPTELLAKSEPIGQHVRLGGLVQEGTLTCSDGFVQFTITDRTTELSVIASDSVALMCPREGVGVVVEGALNMHGVFSATQVIVKHDENYVAPSEGQLPSQVIDPGT